MFYIGEFSQMSKTTIKTLHYYDRIGLLHPEKVDEESGYRMYSTQQLVNIHHIQSLRQIGLSIDQIRKIFNNGEIESVLEEGKPIWNKKSARDNHSYHVSNSFRTASRRSTT